MSEMLGAADQQPLLKKLLPFRPRFSKVKYTLNFLGTVSGVLSGSKIVADANANLDTLLQQQV